MYPHAFRHVAAKLFLDKNPGQIGLVAQLLGNTVEACRAFYCEFNSKAAARHYDEMILRRSFRSRPRRT
jgi:hypothetical protein